MINKNIKFRHSLLFAAIFLDACSGGSSSTSGSSTVPVTPAYQESVLYSFSKSGASGYTPAPVYPGYFQPKSTLILGTDANFYGTNYVGGTSSNGAVFRMTSFGVAASLYSFAGGTGDGMNPTSLIEGSDGNFYGLTLNGGTFNEGVLFKLTPAGVESIIYNFGSSTADAAFPYQLIQGSDGNFYGLANGGSNSYSPCSDPQGCGYGALFKVTAAGVESVVYSFGAFEMDATAPSSLIQGSDGNLYGLTSSYGIAGAFGISPGGAGTMFKVTPTGTLTTIHQFNGYVEGAFPSNLIEGKDGNFYGVTSNGGPITPPNCNALDSYCGAGTFFKATTAGVITPLINFSSPAAIDFGPISFIQGSDGNFYGVTSSDGSTNDGAMIQMTSSGIYSVLYSFGANSTDTITPVSIVQASGGNFYGISDLGGANGIGTFFSVVQ